jgi:hypothetical protein
MKRHSNGILRRRCNCRWQNNDEKERYLRTSSYLYVDHTVPIEFYPFRIVAVCTTASRGGTFRQR